LIVRSESVAQMLRRGEASDHAWRAKTFGSERLRCAQHLC
jgi:hypothetical protein